MKALFIIKTDGYPRSGTILKELEENNINILAIKSAVVTRDAAEHLYEEHKGKYFYETLITYLTSAKVILLAVEGNHEKIFQCKKNLRSMLKPYVLEHALENLTTQIDKLTLTKKPNLDQEFLKMYETEYGYTFDGIHCSDLNQGEKEINLFFTPQELVTPVLTPPNRIRIILEKIDARKKSEESPTTQLNRLGLFNDNFKKDNDRQKLTSDSTPSNNVATNVRGQLI